MAMHERRSINPLSYVALVSLMCLIGAMLVVWARSSQNMAVISGKGMSLEAVQRMVDTDIPIGSSKNQVEKWFKGRGIRYGYLDAKRGQLKYEPLAKHSGIPLSNLSGILTAVVPGYSGNIIKCHTYMAFIIDKEGKVVNRHISGACTNPAERLEF